jgi:hypothetical protein
MSYIIQTFQFDQPMYFMEHAGAGFTITTDPEQAKIYRTKKQAVKASAALEEASNMTCEMKKK